MVAQRIHSGVMFVLDYEPREESTDDPPNQAAFAQSHAHVHMGTEDADRERSLYSRIHLFSRALNLRELS